MLDFNSQSSFADQVNAYIDDALVVENQAQPSRQYLGGSRLGVACDRALQFEYAQAPKDDGRDFKGQTLRIFAAGHLFEDMAIRWLHMAGFDLYTTNGNRSGGKQFGFSVADGRIRGHVDGIINVGPVLTGFPALWECKSMNAKSWKDTVKKGLAVSKPVYAAQVAVYQAYMEATVPGISQNPALFTAINKDTSEIYHEQVPFDGGMAQKMSDKGVRIIQATEAGELLPRIAQCADFFECKFCDWADRCWRTGV